MAAIDLTDDDVFMFLKTLERLQVKYLLVGGFAMAFHGYVRATHDLDLWLKDDAGNIELFKKALTENGVVGLDKIGALDFVPGFTEFKICFAKKRLLIDQKIRVILNTCDRWMIN